ncbi:two-component system sensor histidine kinase NtrB [Dehalobacterium formicoaceticum]|uniref:two-component system sensor histidine kinase NtrB n=1 Tax=Dehalobacterium formicoaceticum TaxID=51515 RepID=UPI000B7DE01A|nr:ATP-binding protein [Dehalobacterium formicoaceticum]
MPVIVLSLKYGLRMALLSAFLIIIIDFYHSYLYNFVNVDADIMLAGIITLLAWLLGHMMETQYENRARLEEDIIYRKGVAKKNEEQLAFLQNLIDTIPHPIFQTDDKLYFTMCNKSFEDFFGVSRGELLDKTIWDLFPMKLALDFCAPQRALPFVPGSPHGEYKLTNREGAGREVILNKAKAHHMNGHGNGFLGIILDQTEQKQFQREMARMEKLNLVGEMAAGIAHEIRNPISTVKGFLQLYQIDEDGETLKDHVGLMIEELDRANSIITVYLSLAKDKATSLVRRQLNEVISTLAPLIESDAMITEHGVTFELNPLPEIFLDESEIKQMLLNFCRNGFDAMEKGGNLMISTYVKDQQVVLEIKDQGRGIAPEIMEKLGTPFVTNKPEGTGLGLAVCFSVAARHHAAITYDTGSEGTSFYVRFPKYSFSLGKQ